MTPLVTHPVSRKTETDFYVAAALHLPRHEQAGARKPTGGIDRRVPFSNSADTSVFPDQHGTERGADDPSWVGALVRLGRAEGLRKLPAAEPLA